MNPLKLLLCTLLAAPALLSAAVTDGLVAHYKFDETSGTTTADSIRGAPGEGTLTNFGASPWVAGKIGGAVELDGGNDWITTANAIADNTTTMSFSGWVWADSRPTWSSISKNWGNSQVGQYHFGLDGSSGQLSNYITNGTKVAEPALFPTGSWQHVAFTYDGTTHRLYRNGVQVAALTTTTTLVRNSAITAMGCKTNNGGTAPDSSLPSYWDGKYDDFGFWNRALTAAEVLSIYNDGNAGKGIGANSAPSIPSFTANPANVPTGNTTTLSWTVQDAVSVTIEGGPLPLQDVTGQTSKITPPLTTDTTFTLTATNANGSTTATRIVGVGAAIEEPVINEFLAANDTGIEDAEIGGSHEDWIEIYNPNTLYALELAGYHLTDDAGNLGKWTFPAVTLPPGGYLIVFASEKNRAVPGQPLHTNFKLSENGEYLALVKPDGTTIVQEFAPAYPNQTSDVSYSSAGYLATPTPGAVNSALSGPAIAAVTQNPPPPADVDALTINARVTPQGTSTVTAVNLLYRVNYGAEVTLPMTLNQGVYSAVIPATASTPGQMIRWRVTATDSAARSSKAPLFRDPSNSPEYYGTMVQDTSFTTQLPVVYRFVQNTALVDNDPGTRCSIFMNGEFFDNCGVRIRGFTSRGWPKKSHKIEGNSGYKFRFKTDGPRVTEFDLNTTYTDKSYLRAILTAEMQRSIGMVCPELFPVQVRQNGAFYSVAIMTENPDKDFLSRNGVDPDGAYYKAPTNNFYTTSSTFEKKTRLYETGKADLDALIAGVAQTGTPLETYVFDNVDLPAMINYMATTCISQNIDASDKNHFAYRDTNGSKEWSMLPWDLDLTFGPNALNTDTIVYNQTYASHPFIGASPYLLSPGKYNRFLEAIVNTPRTRAMLIRRIRSLTDQFLANNWFQNRIDQMVPILDPDVTQDHAKWGSSSHFGGVTHTLLAANNRIKTEYLAPRLTYLNSGGTVGIPATNPAAPPIVFGTYDANPASHNQDEEYLQLTNNNAFSVDLSGWKVEGGVKHTIKSGTVLLAGESLYLTPSPTAFRARAAGPRGGQRLFVQGNVDGHLSNFGETLTLKNSAGTVITSLTIPPAPSDPQLYLVISEIMYHPEPDGDAEFVELMNISPSVTLDLTGVHFSQGIDFTFPAGATLAPGARVLVVKNTAAFEAVHGTGKPIAGEFAAAGSLKNSGERIKLEDATNSTIRDFTYSDEAPWPATADGGGSLVLIAPLKNPDHSLPGNWRASMSPIGNPNGEDVLHLLTLPAGDDDGDGIPNLLEYALGQNPQVSASMTDEGLILTVPRVRNADDAVIAGEYSTTLGEWLPAEPVSYGDTTITFRLPSGMAGEKKVFLRATVKMR